MILSIPSCIASDIEAARCTSVASIKSMLDKYMLAFNVMDASCCFVIIGVYMELPWDVLFLQFA